MATQEEIYSQLDISIEEKDKLVADVIHYVLFKNHQSSGCPIKREELTSIITKTYRQRALPALVINEAREKLSSIFGYELKELQRARPLSANQNRSTQQSQADVKSYVLISKLPPEVFQKYVEDKGNMHVTGFTFIAISIVHLAGGQISEKNLWQHLKRLGLFETDQMHPVLGDVKQALESLVQRRYLQKNKVNGPEGNILVYELAERALDKANFILVNARMKEYISQNANKEVQTGEDDEEQEEDD
ncbi:uncharacterized protein LOC113353115 isoform X1 [Papaver somniferum]|uniref:uncharacterized protein LOC113353115 isoform X1 n=1 Tax=Papaver somniferum TaxID=3469 RepID=UPI000E7049CC|nr:uncharacterized protein LOC113353115 isoform X1 [Papaver somniferum]